MPEGWHFSRIGTPSSMSGGMQSLTGVETGLYGANLPVGVIAHFDASQQVYSDLGSTPITLNGTVEQWNDLSGGGFNLTQTGATARPTYKSDGFTLPIVQFDGSNDCLANASFSTTQPFTVVIAGRVVTIASTTYNFFGNTVAMSGSNPWVGFGAGTNLWWTTADTNRHVFIYICSSNGAIGKIFHDTTQDATGSMSTGAPNKISLGGEATQGFGSISIGELFIYDHALSSTERGLIQPFLKAKWGTT